MRGSAPQPDEYKTNLTALPLIGSIRLLGGVVAPVSFQSGRLKKPGEVHRMRSKNSVTRDVEQNDMTDKRTLARSIRRLSARYRRMPGRTPNRRFAPETKGPNVRVPPAARAFRHVMATMAR